ncbi:MAG: tail assembly protein [Marivivens sp.]|nr:tail assembly protein [Marivivens sp.]NCW67010.1 tail assembly protein [Marivivens sp.]
MQQVVRLLGDLGERYGAEHTYCDLRTPADAVKLLCINIPELQEELIHAHDHGIGYRLIQVDTDLGYEDLHLPIGSNDLILTPVIVGSADGGTGQILAGVGLIAASFLFPGAGLFGASAAGVFSASLGAGTLATLTSVGTGLSVLGASLILGGVAQMLSPQPTIPNLSGANRLSSAESTSTDGPQSITRGTDGRQSYAYTGAANTVGVGATIPVAYGEVLIGSHLLSANVEVTDESDPLRTAIKEPGVDTVLLGGEKLTYSFSSVSGVEARRSTATFRNSTNRRKERNAYLPLSNGYSISGGSSLKRDSGSRTRFDFVFELQNGLFDYVSGIGSSLVDAFITYRLTLSGNFDEGPDQDIGFSQATIQGLLLPGQRYKWMHRMEHSDSDALDSIDPKVEIIDFRANSGCQLFWQSYGYRMDNYG